MTLLGSLALALVAFQVLLVLLARWLGRPLAWEAVAIGLLLPFLVLWPWLDGDPLLVPTASLAGQIPGTLANQQLDDRSAELIDVVLHFLPWELEIRHALAGRRLPLWSDLLDGGSSPWINPQAGILSPIAWGGRFVPIQHFLLVAFALKMLIAFQGAWVLGRRLTLRRPVAIVVGLGFALGGALAAWGLFTLSSVAAWTPWLGAGVVQLARRPGRRALAATSACAAFVFLSGHPEVAAGAALFCGALAILLRRRGHGWGPLGSVAAAAVLGAALAGPQLVPFVAALPETLRAREQLASAAGAHETTWSPRTWFREYRGDFFKAPASPEAFGKPFAEPFRGPYSWTVASAAYAGLWAWAGLALALAHPGLGRRIAFIGLGGILLASQFLPLDGLLRAVPILRVPEWSRVLPIASLAIALAAGLGWQSAIRQRHRWRLNLALALAAGASLLLSFDERLLLLWLGLGAVWLLARRWRPIAPAGLALLVLLDLVPWNRAFLPEGRALSFYPETSEVGELRTLLSEGNVARAMGQDLLAYPNTLPVYGLAETLSHDPMAPAAYLRVLRTAFGFAPSVLQYFGRVGNLDHPMLDYLAVRAVFTNQYLPQPAGFERVSSAHHLFWILRNPEAKPRFFVPSRVEFVPDRDLEGWIAAMTTADIVAVVRPTAAPAAAQLSSGVLVLEETPGRVRLQVDGSERRFLATSLPHFAGWTSRTANGTSLEREAVFGAFAGFWVPAGAQTVELRFIPPGLLAGVLAFLLGGVALGVLLVPSRRLRKGRTQPIG